MQKHVNLVDLVKSFPTNIYLQNLASIRKRTSPIEFAHLAEKSEKGSISNLSTKVLVQEARSLEEHRAISSRYQRLDHHWERKQVGGIETRTLRGRFSKIVSILLVLVLNDLLLAFFFKSSSGTSRSSLAKTLIRGF